METTIVYWGYIKVFRISGLRFRFLRVRVKGLSF